MKTVTSRTGWLMSAIAALALAACQPNFDHPSDASLSPETDASTSVDGGGDRVVEVDGSPERDGGESSADAGPEPEPMRLIYAIHTHVSDDRLPFTRTPMGCRSQTMDDCTLDPLRAENMLAMIEGVRDVLEAHGMRGSWQGALGPLKGLCEYQADQPTNIFADLRAAGHEVGIHAHDPDDLTYAADYFTDTCGLGVPRTGTGLAVWFNSSGAQLAADYAEAMQTLVDLGIRVATTNMGPDEDHDMAPVCTTDWGVGNDSWEYGTDNVMFPFKPNYEDNVPCEHDPDGQFVVIDHSAPDWAVSPEGVKADVFDASHFSQLQERFDAALAYLEANPTDRIPVWGFVSHITEYARGSQALNPVDQDALDALDAFLTYVDTKVAEGRVVYATPEAVAAEIFPEVFDSL